MFEFTKFDQVLKETLNRIIEFTKFDHSFKQSALNRIMFEFTKFDHSFKQSALNRIMLSSQSSITVLNRVR